MKALFGLIGTLLLTLFLPLAGIWRLVAVSCNLEYFSTCNIGGLNDWQAAIGAIVGFNGLLIGALYNAHLNRRRDDRLREMDARAFAISLVGEVRTIRNMALNRGRLFAYYITTDQRVPHLVVDKIAVMPETPIFVSRPDKLGLLGPNLANRLSEYYFGTRELLVRIHWIASKPEAMAIIPASLPGIDANEFESIPRGALAVSEDAQNLIFDLLVFAGQDTTAKTLRAELSAEHAEIEEHYG